MNYEDIKELALQLSYKGKFRLAQILLEVAQEEQQPQRVIRSQDEPVIDLEYVSKRLLTSRPSKVKTLENFIEAMFQFKRSISREEKSEVISQLQQKNIIKIEKNKVIYLT